MTPPHKTTTPSWPWAVTFLICVPLSAAGFLSSSRFGVLWVFLSALGLGLWAWRKRTRDRDSRFALGAVIVLVMCPTVVAVPFLLRVAAETVMGQPREAIGLGFCLLAAYGSVRNLTMPEEDRALPRLLLLAALGASVFFGGWAFSRLQWASGPSFDDVFGWRFRYDGPERPRP